jgi:hypothetical protein
MFIIDRLRVLLILVAIPLLSSDAQERAASQMVDCSRVSAVADHANMDHKAHQAQLAACAKPSVPQPTLPGQAAFGAIAEVVRILVADPATDWAKVNVEALRQHLIDMDHVTVRSTIAQREVPGGFVADITGAGSVTAAIRRMVPTHTSMYASATDFRATTRDIPGGVRLTMVARNATDAGQVARLRGLGTIGFLVDGDHHTVHHLALARGDKAAHSH